MTEEQLRDALARLIDPDGWKLRDHGALPLDHPGAQAVVKRSRETAQTIIDTFSLAVDRRSVSRTLPQFGGQPAYYNPDAVKNGGAIGAHIASLPVEFRIVGGWMPEESND